MMRKIGVILRFLGLAIVLAIAGCATAPGGGGGGSASKGSSAHYKIGKPYKINGRWYRPAEDPTYDRTGVASWYGSDFHGKPTANGEVFDMRRMTAAHTTLPLPSMVEVTNLDNGRRAVVRVNDRGPFAHNRIIDLSREAARKLGFEHKGLAKVRVKFLGPAPLPGEGVRPLYAERKPAPQPKPVIETAPPPVARALSPTPTATIDEMADLIAGAVPDTPSLSPVGEATAPPAQIAAAPREYVIQVAVIENIEALPTIRERLSAEGPLSIARFGGDEAAPRYRINLGPFPSVEAASASLERVREAGYDTAVIIAQRAS